MSAVLLQEIKEYLRYDDSDISNDATLSILLAGAQRWVENHSGHLLVPREVSESPAAFPVAPSGQVAYHDLRWKPADIDTLAIAYLDADLASATFTAFTAFPVNGTHRIVANSAWPTGSGITISYTAGYASVEAVPEDLLHAMMIYAGMADKGRIAPDASGWKTLENILMHYRMPVLA